MLFKFDFRQEFNLSKLEKNMKYYTSMMHVLEVEILKYQFSFKDYYINLNILKEETSISVSKYSVTLDVHHDYYNNNNTIIDVYYSVFLNKFYNKSNIDNITDDVCIFLKILYKFDKLKVFI